MKTTDNNNSYPYGTVNLCLAQRLYKQDDCSALMLHLYIGARRNLKDSRWEFNIPDISMQTGVDRRVLAKHVRILQLEDVFIPAGQTSKGALKFTLNEVAYDRRYVNVQVERCASSEHPKEPECTRNAHTPNPQRSAGCASSVHADVHAMNTPCASSEHPHVHCVQGGCALDVEQDVHAMYTKNIDKEEEEECRQKERKEEANPCLSASLTTSHSPELYKPSLNPFSRPILVKDPNSPAQRNEVKRSQVKANDSAKSELLKGSTMAPMSGTGQLSETCQPSETGQLSERSSVGKSTVGASSSNVTDTKPYDYTIGNETHEIRFDSEESNAAIPAIEKATVLKHALAPFTTIGDTGVPRASVLQVNGRSFELARQFFEANPSLPVFSLLKVLWECNRVAYENPVKDNGFKPCFSHRAATESLTYLMKNLEMINGTMPDNVRLPDTTEFLTVSPAHSTK
jgi:hypothetical protein